MTEENTQIDGRTAAGFRNALAKKTISRESYDAGLRGELGLQEAKELGREAGPNGPAKPESRISKADRSRLCMCGCGEQTSGGRFRMGHDMRLVGMAKEYVRGQREFTEEQLEYVQASGKLDRARERVLAEDERAAHTEDKRREREAKKAAKQNQQQSE